MLTKDNWSAIISVLVPTLKLHLLVAMQGSVKFILDKSGEDARKMILKVVQECKKVQNVSCHLTSNVNYMTAPFKTLPWSIFVRCEWQCIDIHSHVYWTYFLKRPCCYNYWIWAMVHQSYPGTSPLLCCFTVVSSKCHFPSLSDGSDSIIDLYICMAMPIFTI